MFPSPGEVAFCRRRPLRLSTMLPSPLVTRARCFRDAPMCVVWALLCGGINYHGHALRLVWTLAAS